MYLRRAVLEVQRIRCISNAMDAHSERDGELAERATTERMEQVNNV